MERFEPMDDREFVEGNIYIIGDWDDDNNNDLFRFIGIEERDYQPLYRFENIRTNNSEVLNQFEINDTEFYDVTMYYNIQNMKKIKHKTNKDIASVVGEYLGVNKQDIISMYNEQKGGKQNIKKTNKRKSKKRKSKKRKSKRRKTKRTL